MPNLVIAASASGDTTLLAAVSSRRWLVRKMVLVAKAAVDIKFKSGATDVTGVMGFAANQAMILPWQSEHDQPWFLGSAINQALVINLGAAIVVGGFLVYDLVEG